MAVKRKRKPQINALAENRIKKYIVIIIYQRDLHIMPKGRKGSGTKRLALAALKMAKQNKRNIDGERKFVNIEVGQVDIDITSTTNITLLTEINQQVASDDATASLREGDDVGVRSLLIRGNIEYQSGGPNAMVRMFILMKLNDTRGTPIIFGSVGNDNTVLKQSVSTHGLPLAPLLWENRRNWKILSDDLFVGNPDSVDNLVFKKYMKFRHKAYYDASTATTGAKKGNIYICLLSNQTVAANQPHISFFSRITYVDN